jgi:hypothetical protein
LIARTGRSSTLSRPIMPAARWQPYPHTVQRKTPQPRPRAAGSHRHLRSLPQEAAVRGRGKPPLLR